MTEEKVTDFLDPDHANRVRLALTGSSEDIFRVSGDPSMDVLRALLKNNSLEEAHLLIILKRGDLSVDLIKAIYEKNRSMECRKVWLALVYNKNTPSSIVLGILPLLHLFELVGVSILPGIAPDQRYAVEREIVRRLPLTPLGNKMTLARRGSAYVVGELLKEGEPSLMEPCLSNPRLREADICMFAGSAKANADTLSAVARHPRWKARMNIKLALLKNRKTPVVWFTVFLPTLPVNEIRNLLSSRRLDSARIREVETELKRRGGL